MAYLDVVTLIEAKNYLRVDDDLTDDDTAIEGMIKASLSSIEKRTNNLVYQRDEEYLFSNGCVLVYDYPIDSVVTPTDTIEVVKPTYSVFTSSNAADTTLTITVGHLLPANVPDEIKQCALNMIKYYYYEAETDKANKGNLPAWLNDTVNQLRRFYV